MSSYVGLLAWPIYLIRTRTSPIREHNSMALIWCSKIVKIMTYTLIVVLLELRVILTTMQGTCIKPRWVTMRGIHTIRWTTNCWVLFRLCSLINITVMCILDGHVYSYFYAAKSIKWNVSYTGMLVNKCWVLCSLINITVMCILDGHRYSYFYSTREKFLKWNVSYTGMS